LVAASGQTAVSTDSLSALGNGELAAYLATTDSTTSTSINGSTIAPGKFYFAQGLNRTDAIEKELGIIKSGVIDLDKIVSIRKVSGTSDYSRQFKVFGSGTTLINPIGGSSNSTSIASNPVSAVAGSYYHIATGTHLFYCLVSGATNANGDATGLSAGDLYVNGAATFVYLGAIYSASAYTALVPSIALAKPGTSATAAAGTLEFEADKEYTFSVRVRSAQANSISPFGITRGYSAMAANTFVNTTSGAASTSDIYAPFSAMFNLVKNFGADTMLKTFANVDGVIYSCASTNGTVTDTVYFIYNDTSGTTVTSGADANAPVGLTLFKGTRAVTINTFAYDSWHSALTAAQALVPGFYPAVTTVVSGATYTASLLVEALEQVNYNLSYASGVTDPTVFPYKWDMVRLNGFFHEGPYGKTYDWYATAAINAGVSTQTPIVFDQTQSGLISLFTLANTAYTVNSLTVAANYAQIKYADSAYSAVTEVKFPNLLKEEVRHIAHQYQSYSLKYKQQFRNPRFNAMVMDPFQSKIDAAGPYTLYYIEYMPDVDTSYTSTQPMTNLTVIAVPTVTSGSGIIQDIDEILTDANITAESAS
jgi:hypothetical protein